MNKQMQVLTQLAGQKSDLDPDLKNILGDQNELPESEINTRVRELLEQRLEEQQRNVAVEAADIIIKLLDTAKLELETSVAKVRSFRQAERQYLAKIKRVERARQYGKATGNWLPLAHELEEDVSNVDEKLFTIPDGWEPNGGKTDAPTQERPQDPPTE